MSSPRAIAEKRRGSYKTELCKAFLESRECPHGKECTFAHGCGELQERPRPSNYRTKVCNKMCFNDDCPYGDKCNFDHDPVVVFRARAELRAAEERKQAQQLQQQVLTQEHDVRYLSCKENIALSTTNPANLNALNIVKDNGQKQQPPPLPQIPSTGLPTPESLQERFGTIGEIQQKIEQRDSSYYNSSFGRGIFIPPHEVYANRTSVTFPIQTPQQAISSPESTNIGSSCNTRPTISLNIFEDANITTSAALSFSSIPAPLAGNHLHQYGRNLASESRVAKQEDDGSSSLDSAFSELTLHSPTH